MRRRTFIKHTGTAGLITLITPSVILQAFDPTGEPAPEQDFRQPPASASPQVFWFWMNGHITKEGITLDLEAMKRVGISGVFNYDVGTGIPKGPVAYLSMEWAELKRYAVQEAHRLGLEFTLHNCPGWSASGGPWITPGLAMQQVTWSESYVSGGRSINIYLPQPASRLESYRDIAVVAFPSLEGEELLQTIKASTNSGPVDKNLLTGKEPPGVVVYPGEDHKAWLQLEFAEPYEARLITFFISAITTNTTVNKPLDFGERTSIILEASDDGTNFRTVTPINTGLDTELLLGDKIIVFDIPVTKAKYFRLTSTQDRRYKQVQFSGITRLKNWMEKTNLRSRNIMNVAEASTIERTNDQAVPQGSIIDVNAVVDISRYMDKEGLLNWPAPAGNWTVLRIGFTPTGALNRAAPDNGIGLECDKYNPEAITLHVHKMLEPLLPALMQLTGKKKIGLEIDSYEAGGQNWTPGFEQAFQQRWNYSILQFLPVLAGGRIVRSVEVTERFLWDLRRLQADLMAQNYYGRFRELCHQHGFTAYIEPYESGPMEEMQAGSKGDVLLGEFWSGISSALPAKTPALRTPKLVSSIAHINGQKVVGTEAFTADPESGRWQQYPFSLKALGDQIFTRGVNRMVIHRYAHQPHPSAVPGMTMGPYGIHFERTNTWWKQSPAWLTYLSRCQYLLQQGSFVADLAYFTGEDANMYTKANPEELHPTPPEGYDYDLINADILMKQASIRNNRMALPQGASYRLLVLQDFKALTLPLLRKLRELVAAGMILVGAKPERSAGLADYANGDAEFNQLAHELWSNSDHRTGNRFGKGRVFSLQPLAPLLQQLNIPPDFEYSSRSGDAPVLYTHRKIGDVDTYFLSNQRRTYEEVVGTFRVQNKRPELWDPVTGKITPMAAYELIGERVRVPLQLGPYGSVFVVFSHPASSRHLHAVEKDHQSILSTKNFPTGARKLYSEVTNNFTISLWAKPEINVLLNPEFVMGTITQPWTEYYALFPPNGSELYGAGHATCGLAIGRNGVAVWENSTGTPALVLAAPAAIAGWSHIALQYENDTPSVFLNGTLVQRGRKSKQIIHPAVDKVYLKEGASFYNGDMTPPSLFREILNEDHIRKLATQGLPLQVSPFVVEMTGSRQPTLLITQNGTYTLHYNTGAPSSFKIASIGSSLELKGPWQVGFPPGLGAPAHIQLPELISLHRHPENGVKYFSGTATYTKTLGLPQKPSGDKRLLLDLGRVEVLAEVIVNGQYLGTLWTRPYRVDITPALQSGTNHLEIKVTNLWPNRLIGDEQLPEPDKFSPPGSLSGRDALTSGYIEQLPDWYIQGQPKPANGRITFTTWKHYIKDSPLLESGLLGPVTILQAVVKPL